jgi:hydroxycarboxylate dehydrogenase B
VLYIPHTTVRALGFALFQSAGLPEEQAAVAIDHLVESNLMGHDSHGVIRVPGYLNAIRNGAMRPVGEHRIVRETPTSAVIDANHSFGIVLAYEAMQMAVQRAKEYTFGGIAVHHSTHIGRLGAYPPLAAQEECIGVCLLNGGARFTAPFGGVGRRLPPNPISIAIPTGTGASLMLDITTSMAAGGKVDVYRARGLPVPDGWLVNQAGDTVTDPNLFRGNDVAMLPLGGPLGYKGYGLAMMIDAIAGGLSWAGCSSANPTRGGSGYLMLAINIASFIDPEEFKQEVQHLINWVKSSPTMPGVDHIRIPGEIEDENLARRTESGLPIEETTWQEICDAAGEFGVAVPAF